MGSIQKLLNSTTVIHVSNTITDKMLQYLPDSAKLQGMHKAYTCDFNENKRKLAEKSSSKMKEE